MTTAFCLYLTRHFFVCVLLCIIAVHDVADVVGWLVVGCSCSLYSGVVAGWFELLLGRGIGLTQFNSDLQPL